jgi:hypothetical protein
MAKTFPEKWIMAGLHGAWAVVLVAGVLACGCSRPNTEGPSGRMKPPAPVPFSITLGARDVRKANISLLEGSHGLPEQPVRAWATDQAPTKYLLFEVMAATTGRYALAVTQAATVPLPMDVFVNEQLVLGKVGGSNTCGYDVQFQRRVPLGEITLRPGKNSIMLHMASAPVISGITLDHLATSAPR